MKINARSQLKMEFKRHNIFLSIEGLPEDSQSSLLSIKIDGRGYDETRRSITRSILIFLEQLEITNPTVERECIGMLEKIVYLIPFFLRSKPHKAIALTIILFSCRKL